MQNFEKSAQPHEVSGAFQRDEQISILFWLWWRSLGPWIRGIVFFSIFSSFFFFLRGLFYPSTFFDLPIGFNFIFLVLLGFYARWSLRRNFRNQFDQFYGENSSVHYSWDDEFFKFAASKGENSILWRQAFGWALGDKALLIYITKFQPIICPLRLFTPEQRDDLLLQLKRHDIPERFKRKRGK